MGIASSLRDTSASVLDDTINGDLPRPKPNADELAKAILNPAASDDELGRLDGYRVLEVLGIGGMGVVFKAEDSALKRLVALKVMLPHLSVSGDSSAERFLREAQAAAAITHDNIVTIHQVGKDGGVPFLAMQLLEGRSLGERLASAKQLSIADVGRVARQTADGLSAAHDKGLMHRDIKPENIWLEESRRTLRGRNDAAGEDRDDRIGHEVSDYRVKILDFGLAISKSGSSTPTRDLPSVESTRVLLHCNWTAGQRGGQFTLLTIKRPILFRAKAICVN